MHPKILYVEDNSVIRERVAAHLRAEGFAVEECADALYRKIMQAKA